MKLKDAACRAENRRGARCWTLRIAASAALLFLMCCFGVRRAAAQIATDDKESCQFFVQNFYDWYWNSYADQADMPGLVGRSLADVVKRKPPVLDPELLKLLKYRVHGGRTGSLDFDPFLNSNSPHGKYMVSKVLVSGDTCRATIDAGHEIAALKRAGLSWVFVDFHYSYYYDDGSKQDIPDADLILMLTS
jgi:hypothetical protein